MKLVWKLMRDLREVWNDGSMEAMQRRDELRQEIADEMGIEFDTLNEILSAWSAAEKETVA